MKRERNYGLDLFRMFSMFCVIILHLLGHGGALSATSSNANFTTLCLWEVAAFPAVNCFVLISGFVGFRPDKICPKISNIITIIISTFFYSTLSFFVYRFVFHQEAGMKQFLFSILPVMTKQYWFVSAYVGMFFLTPIINFFVSKAERKMLVASAAVVLCFSVFSLIKDPFDLNYGYSTAWFVLLYLLGAIIKKEDVLDKLSVLTGLVCIAIGFFATFGVKLLCSFLGSPFSAYENIFVSYCSPTILVMAIGWMVMFSKIQTTPTLNRIISAVTPSVFSVYLIHDNRFIRTLFITDHFRFINAFNPVITSSILLASALSIFLICLLIDMLRVVVFKILHIPQIILLGEEKINKFFLYVANTL